MSDDIKPVRFAFTEKEAEAAARCELGIGDMPRTMSMILTAAVVLTVAVRIAKKMPLPSFRLMACYGACLAAWIFFLILTNRRLKRTAEDIRARDLYFSFDDIGLYLRDENSKRRFACSLDEVQAVEKGELICRVSCPAGRFCFPLRLADDLRMRELDSLQTASHITRSWM